LSLEHLEAVKDRIEEIRRRFVGMDDALAPKSSGAYPVGQSGFADALNKARSVKPSPCPADLEPVIASAAQKYGVDPALVKAVIRAESGFRQEAVSRTGALGLMQLMPGTARALGVDPSDAAENVEGGVKYLKQQLDRFGNVEDALAAYNAGPGSVVKYGGVPPYTETQRYVAEVLRYKDSYSEEE
jgi:soluble lytic murein transglycosylase-like protein